MKSKFWILEDGEELKATYKEFKYWHDNYGNSVMHNNGQVFNKGEISIRKVELVYNSFGFAIAGRK